MGNDHSRNAALSKQRDSAASKADAITGTRARRDVRTTMETQKSTNDLGKAAYTKGDNVVCDGGNSEGSAASLNSTKDLNLDFVNEEIKSMLLGRSFVSTATTTCLEDGGTIGENPNNSDDENCKSPSTELVSILFDQESEQRRTSATNSVDRVENELCEEFIIKNSIESTALQLQDSINHITDNSQFDDESDPEDSRNGEDFDNASCLYDNDEESEEAVTFPGNLEDGSQETRNVHIFSHREVRNGKVIGEGAFGRVLKGSLCGGTPVAIKLFHRSMCAASEQQQQELNKLLTLQHKNVVTILGLIEQTEDIDCTQVVYQYFPEGSILQYLSKHDNPEDAQTIGKMVLDVIEGCQYLQECGIVNGNLAARNILIGRVVGRHKTYFNAKITDVGILRFVEPTGGHYMRLVGSELIVPVRWVPKEIIEEQEDGSQGTDFTFASDVWAFGVVLWEIWTRGAIPYGASYSNLRVIQFLKSGYSPLKVHRPSDCPPKVVSVLESIFKVNPNDRPSFDKLHGIFKLYKGHGKENKPVKPPSPGEVTAVPGVTDAVEETTAARPEINSASVGEKEVESSLPKKKKNKKNKKFPPRKGEGVADVNIPSAPVAAPSGSLSVDGVDGAWSLPLSPKPQYQAERPKPQQDNADAQIAALIKRVNQLEKERRGFGTSVKGGRGGRGGRGGSGPKPSNWQKKMGPPRFHEGYPEGDYNEGRVAVPSRNRLPTSQSPLPPPSSQAPPPYTEEPLPHHSSSHFPKPLPEYGYGRGRISRGGGPAFVNNIAPRHRPGTSNQRSNSGGMEEDFIRKIKRLAEEIEVLRAEKMTQELLKKSAELADIMKVMTTERTDGSSAAMNSSYAGNAVLMENPSSRDARGRAHYANEFDSYDYNGDDTGRQWAHRENQGSYHDFPPPQSSRPHRGTGALPPRRPYYKGRGTGGSGFRGNGRYNSDRHGDGSY